MKVEIKPLHLNVQSNTMKLRFVGFVEIAKARRNRPPEISKDSMLLQTDTGEGPDRIGHILGVEFPDSPRSLLSDRLEELVSADTCRREGPDRIGHVLQIGREHV